MAQAEHTNGWFEKIKNSFNADAIAEKLHLTKHKVFDMALFLGVGFLIGFLWKRYANYFIAFVLFIAGCIILHQLDLISININWDKVQECCGIEPISDEMDLFSASWQWIKLNILVVFSFIIGFCLGIKIS